MAHPYEIVVILRPEGTEDHVKQLLTKTEELIKKEGCTIATTESWGRRRLAFPIKKQKEGVYYLLKVDAEAPAIDRVKHAFRLDESIIRVMIVRADDALAVAPARGTVTLGQRPEWT